MSKKFPFVLGVPLLLSPCFGQTPVKMDQAYSQISSLKSYFAKKISTHTDIFDSKHQLAGFVEDVDVFERLKGEVPQRVRQSHNVSGGKKVDFPDIPIVDVADHPEKAFLRFTNARLRGREKHSEGECQVFDVEGKDEDNTPFKGKIWLQADNGHPVRSEYVMDVSGIPMVKELRYSTTFGADGLPSKVIIDFSFSFLFKKGSVRIQQQLSEWIERANTRR